MNAHPVIKQRPEFEQEPSDASVIGDVERPLSLTERVIQNEMVQRIAILVVLLIVWELYARWLNNALLFPTFSETVRVWVHDVGNGVLIDRTLTSLRTLALGYAGQEIVVLPEQDLVEPSPQLVEGEIAVGFDPGHDEAAWAKNRRAEFVIQP